MTPTSLSRRLATLLLESAISIAPRDTLEWGHAMLAELSHVEGNWSALLWSFGSASVLARHALLSLIFPSPNRPTLPSGGALFSKEGPMRKSALTVTAACIIASLLFFIAPVFRQAFSISLLQWQVLFKSDYSRLDPEVQAIAEKAEKNRDAEALAFVAFRQVKAEEAARLADEAVHIDPNLTWVYAVVSTRWFVFPETDRLVSALEKYDPQNALPHLIAAKKIDVDQFDRHETTPNRAEDRPAAWKAAMSATFESAKFDPYLDRVKALDRRVLLRYNAVNPFLAAVDTGFSRGLSSFGSINDSFIYAESILASAERLERKGDSQGAAKQYLAIAHFFHLMSPDVRFWFAEVTEKAYMRLSVLAAKSGRPAEAAFYSFLADSARQAKKAQEQKSSHTCCAWFGGGDRIARWDANLAKRSGVVMLLSAAVLLATVFAVILRSRSLRLLSLQPGRLAVALGFSSSVALLVSSLVLRLSYQPYAQIFHSFVHDGDDAGLDSLRNFLFLAYIPIGSEWLKRQDYEVFFWSTVIILCALALLIAVFRYLQTRLRHTPAV